LQPERQHFLAQYTPVDVAFKVVGTGSVGLRDYIVYLEGHARPAHSDHSLSRSRKNPPPLMHATSPKVPRGGSSRDIVLWTVSAPCSSPAIRSSGIRASTIATTLSVS